MNVIAASLTALAAQDVQLTVQGGLIMGVCVVLVLGLTAFCMYRLLREPHPGEHHHAPLGVDTHDLE